MNELLYQLDAYYASLPDGDLEVLWRQAVVRDPDAREPLLRQVVLRAYVVIDTTCRRQGDLLGFTEHDIDCACAESALRLMSRLRVDASVRDVRALAHQLASEVIADPDRRRAPVTRRLAPQRPRLRLIRSEESQ